MKKLLTICAAGAIGGSLFAGSILTNRLEDGSFVYTFNTNSTFTIPEDGSIHVLVVGGGGAGGGYAGGGGGGGAVMERAGIAVTKGQTLEVTVGLGGGKEPDAEGRYGQGQSSSLSPLGIVASGGGAGGGYHGATADTASEIPARTGASGGGARAYTIANNLNAIDHPEILSGAAGTPEIGHCGGARMLYAAGGGGGAGSSGGNAFLDSNNKLWAGCGGDGVMSEITGHAVYYGGGGGGGARVDPEYWANTNNTSFVASFGGKGGGGMGRRGEDNKGIDGVDGLGGGGGGGGGNYHLAAGAGRLGGHGGDGVVIIRFRPSCAQIAKVWPSTTGAITTFSNGVFTSIFNSDGSITFHENQIIEILLVGGGGAGGCYAGGGGAGGAVVYCAEAYILAGTYPVSVGQGGTPVWMEADSHMADGKATRFSHLSAAGGGAGGTGKGTAAGAGSIYSTCGFAPRCGGNGGGAAAFTTSNTYNPNNVNQGAPSLDGLGYSGGASCHPAAGGGAGAGGAGGDAVHFGESYNTGYTAGAGGIGVLCEITGSPVYYGGGGGGGSRVAGSNCTSVDTGVSAAGGLGGGGNGALGMTSFNYLYQKSGMPGVDGLGGGGGGGGGLYHLPPDLGGGFGLGGQGGSGIVIIRCNVAPKGTVVILR